MYDINIKKLIIKNISYFIPFVFLGLALILPGCAKVGSPTGGPRDVLPPEVVSSIPVNPSTNFSGNDIEILFDEFIQLSNLNDELLVSPPLEERPVVRVRSRTLVIDLNNDLLPNTTYTLNFGDAIVDNNESNVLSGYEFVFSTGDYIDSLAVAGNAVASFSHEPPAEDEEAYIMLFENLNDSAPYLELPRYIGRINESGLFSIRNIHADTFRVITLLDANRNLRYDPVTDAIGFLDTLTVIDPGTVHEIHFLRDTASVGDTLVSEGEYIQAVELSLDYFYELPAGVFVDSRSREIPQRMFFRFNRPPYDTLEIRPLNFTPDTSWYMRELSTYADTVEYWITDTSVAVMEEISLELTYTTTDSLDRLETRRDSVLLVYRPTGDEIPDTALSLNSNIARSLELNQNVQFTAGKPVASIDTQRISLTRLADSVEVPAIFEIERDPESLRTFRVVSPWLEESQYTMMLLPGAVYDIYGTPNDSLTQRFTTSAENEYGTILLNLQSDRFPLIVQILNSQGNLIRQKPVSASEMVTFDYMPPGDYTLKAIHDSNGNGKWDTGIYLQGIQPERVFVNDIPFTIRSNWEYELNWTVE